MGKFLLVCLGGAVGTGARYLMVQGLGSVIGPSFPFGTLAVNLIGSFLIGIVLFGGATPLAPTLKSVLAIGVLGGFTTYSSFNHETLRYFQDGEALRAFLYMASTLLGCLLAGFLGLMAAQKMFGA